MTNTLAGFCLQRQGEERDSKVTRLWLEVRPEFSVPGAGPAAQTEAARGLPWGQPRRSALQRRELWCLSRILLRNSWTLLSPHGEQAMGCGGSVASAGMALVTVTGSNAAVFTGSSPRGAMGGACVCAPWGLVKQDSPPTPSEDPARRYLQSSGLEPAQCWSC